MKTEKACNSVPSPLREGVQTSGDECNRVGLKRSKCAAIFGRNTKMEDIVERRLNFMYQCDICGRTVKKKIRLKGYTLCSKHMHQLLKYGKFLDNIQRTNNDLNDYKIKDDIAIFNVYNQKNIKVNSFIIDKEDLEKVKYHKWRIDTNNRIITGNSSKSKPKKEITHILLNVPDGMVVDHIDGNSLNNKKDNLRICTQGENLCNKHFMSNNAHGIIGINWDKYRRRWSPEITYKSQRCHLGRYKTIEEAIYVRLLAEVILFKDFQNKENLLNNRSKIEKIPKEKKLELFRYTRNKLVDKYITFGN